METWKVSAMACEDRSFSVSGATPATKRIGDGHGRDGYGKWDDDSPSGAPHARIGKKLMHNETLIKSTLVFGLVLGLAQATVGEVRAGQLDASRAGLTAMAAYLPPQAATQNRAAQFVESLTGQAMIMLRQENISEQGRKDAFRGLLSAGFDMGLIGRVALGRQNWQEATTEQRDEYLDLFGEYLVDAYGSQISASLAQRLLVSKAVRIDDKDTLVHTSLSRNGQTYYQVAWRVRGSGENMRVIDVIIQGVSMLVTHRSEFTAVVARDGIEGLLGHLRGDDTPM